ncbi:MAG: MurR/RpiR family transcriptional regulator [Firmicutes bacterium]|nr:MurR/RpiR family transcriptional regulator [Bacillota bacterium]
MSQQRELRGGLVRIRSVYQTLAPAERKVADYIFENYEQVIYLSVTQLAEGVGVGDSTVIRFCQNAGFRGYQELKLVLARDLVEPSEDLSGGITFDDSLEVMARKVSSANKNALEDTTKMLDLVELERAIEALVQARKIEFYGVGASGITALDAKNRFMRLGLICDAATDSHIQMMSAAVLDERDVVMGISFSGSTKDVVQVVNKAKERGATAICLTAYARSPLANEADIKLINASVETPLGSGALRSKIAQLHILDLLYTGVAMRLGSKGRIYTELTAEAVLDKLY